MARAFAQPLATVVVMSDEILGVPPVVDHFPGIDRIGVGCRIDATVSVYRRGAAKPTIFLGDEVFLYAQCRLAVDDPNEDPSVRLEIGARTIVNAGCYLSGEGGLTIGEAVLIGPHVKILSAGHQIHGGDRWIRNNPLTRAPITIGAGAWIGAGAIILPGVTIGEGAVVGAGAIVTRDVPPYHVALGAPVHVCYPRRMDGAAQHIAIPWWQRLWRSITHQRRRDPS